jgi:ATP-dependent Clp protease adaptor protein ClpS
VATPEAATRWGTLQDGESGNLVFWPVARCYVCFMGDGRRLDEDLGGEVVTQKRTERKLQRPRRYKVLLHNDDYTTMEFVVFVLIDVFRHSEADAVRIMLHVHQKGVGVAGVYSRDVAETRIAQVEALARENEFPLRCSLEEA